MVMRLLGVCFLWTTLLSSFSNAEITDKKELNKKIENLSTLNEIDRMKKLIQTHSKAVVLIHTLSSSAKDDGLIYNTALKKRLKKHHYYHGVTSGVILSKGGIVCATYDGTMNSDEIIVSIDSELREITANTKILLTKNDYKAKVIKAIPELNLIFLKINPKKNESFDFLKLGNDSILINMNNNFIHNGAVVIGKAKGDRFVTISRPANSTNNFDIFSSGVEKLSYQKIDGSPLLIIENAISSDGVLPENNGGAIISLDGKLIGLAIINKDDFSKSSSLGIPVSVIKQAAKIAVPILLDLGANSQFGIKAKDCEDLKLSKTDRKVMGIDDKKEPFGIIVKSVALGSLADNTGIQAGDIILKFNNDIVKKYKTFQNLEKNSIGMQTIILKILRNGTAFDMEINR